MSERNNCFKEAVCVEVQRIFDSCSDRDGIYDLPVTLNADSPAITEDMNVVRVRSAEVEVTCIAVDTVMFKAGYYAVDITYRFKIIAEAFSSNFCQQSSGVPLCGTAAWNKRVILYGSEGNSKIFTSEQDLEPSDTSACTGQYSCSCCDITMPKATVQVVDPVALDAKFVCLPTHKGCHRECVPCCCPPMPGGMMGGGMMPPPQPAFEKTLVVSLGLFSMVQLSRPVSLIIPAYDYCVPGKECTTADSISESASDIFDRLEFPTEQFFPQPSTENKGHGCASIASVIDEV